jgi:alkylhydroperoxidase/carboxymuconolactone decarboxylase family protein YurZ
MADREAWVSIPTSEQLRAFVPPDGHHPYDFGFFPAMARLIAAYPRIAPFFAGLFGQVMFEPGHLDRAEREMVAAVASAAQDCFY